MTEYRYTPKAKNRAATLTVLGLAAAAVGCYLVSLSAPARAVPQFIALLCAAATLFLWLRYGACFFTYMVTDEYGTPQLIITQTQGRRISTVCRVDLGTLFRLDRVSGGEPDGGRAIRERFHDERRRFSYCATMAPALYQVLYAKEAGERFAVRLEGDEAFLTVLERAAAEARAMPREEEE